MSIKKTYFIFGLVVILVASFLYYNFNTSAMPQFELNDPIQKSIPSKIIDYSGKDGQVSIELLASYEVDACIKSIKKYSTDGASSVSPLDFALAWGTLNFEDVDARIRYSQRNRWYYFRYDADTLVTEQYISEHSANTHIIPYDDTILKSLKKVKKSDYITLKGYLVTVHFNNGDWTSSLKRTDTGNGACEILLVNEIIIH